MTSLSSATYYEILGIEKTATKEEIKKAFRESSKQYHPDSNPSSNAAFMFRICVEAKNVLLDDRMRYEYDNSLVASSQNTKDKSNWNDFYKETWENETQNANQKKHSDDFSEYSHEHETNNSYYTENTKFGPLSTRQTIVLRTIWLMLVLINAFGKILTIVTLIVCPLMLVGSIASGAVLSGMMLISYFIYTPILPWTTMIIGIIICIVVFSLLYGPNSPVIVLSVKIELFFKFKQYDIEHKLGFPRRKF